MSILLESKAKGNTGTRMKGNTTSNAKVQDNAWEAFLSSLCNYLAKLRESTKILETLRKHSEPTWTEKRPRQKENQEISTRIKLDRLAHPDNNKVPTGQSETLSENTDEGYCIGSIAPVIPSDWERDYGKAQVIIKSGASDRVGPPSI